jgi:hypothetical protein
MMCKVSCRVAVAGMGDDVMDGICLIPLNPHESFPSRKPGWCSVSLHIRIGRVSLDDTLDNRCIAPNLLTRQEGA